MNHFPHMLRVGDIDMEVDIADYTDPWCRDEPQTILFHNGNSRHMEFWRSWVPALARHYRVVRFNSRGLGATTRPLPDDRYDTNLLVDDAIALLDVLGIDRVHWIGESSGGVFGLVAALRYPKRLHSLILVNTPFKFPEVATQTYNLGEVDHATAIRKHGVGEWSRRTLGFRLDLARAPQDLQDWMVREMDKVPHKVAIDHHLLTVDADLRTNVSAIRQPVLNLVGEKSPLAQGAQMQEMQRVLPDAELVVFEGYGHGINLLAPDRCVAEVLRFLAEDKVENFDRQPA